MKKRTDKILELLTEKEKIEVSALADTFGVSQVTMRKDLDELEQKGVLVRERGFARLVSRDDIAGRIAYHYTQKKQIARKAAALVEDYETIMIENGSCCALLAEELAATKKELTIITNSGFIADFIRKKTDFQIILLGGIYQHDSQVMVGPLVKDTASHFLVDKFFIGVDGYDENAGFTNKDQMRAQAVNDMANQANELIVVTESDKFSQRGTVPLRLEDKKIKIVTDNLLSQSTKTKLENKGYTVIN